MSGLDEFAEAAEADYASDKLRRKNQYLTRELGRAVANIERLEEQVDTLTAIDGVTAANAAWKTPRKKKGRHVGIANLLLSDLHLDEVVNPSEVGHSNAYNRRIAELRLRAAFEKFVMVGKDYIAGISYDGAVVAMLGDTFSGNIHEELKETNECSILESIDHWIDPMVAGLRLVADEFGKVHVPCTPGNHGRNTRKPIHKGRARDNFDFLFMRMVARAMQSDRRVTFDIPDAADTQMRQYGHTFHYTHGDQFKGGSGIAGIFSPLMLGDARKRKRQQAIGAPYDVLCMGHFHQYLPARGLIVNGSLKGLDEYAMNNNFGYEPAQQAFWVTTPEHGVSFSAPIVVQDRDKEGW